MLVSNASLWARDRYCLPSNFFIRLSLLRDRFPTSKACHLTIDYRLSIFKTQSQNECFVFLFSAFLGGHVTTE